MAQPLVGIVMGSDSDWPTMEPAAQALDEFGVGWEAHVLSAHRTPRRMLDWAEAAAVAACAWSSPGPGSGAPAGDDRRRHPAPGHRRPPALDRLDGLDSLLSIVQMPAGVPVATVSIGGGRNAGLLAVRVLAACDDALRARVERFQADLAEAVVARDAQLQQRLAPTAE